MGLSLQMMFKALLNMKRVLPVLLAAAAMTACDDVPNVGNSLVDSETEVVKVSDFDVNGHSVLNPSVQTRNLVQVLGRIDATGYGRLEADFVTQFMPAAQLSSSLTQENIDSIKALFFVPNGSFVGDSLAPMGLEIYRLNKQLPSTIFSNFNPADYYSSSDLLATKMYVCNALGQPDSIRNLSYRLIDVHLPVSLAHEFLSLYQTNPEAYQFPAQFARYFPGIYVRNSYGAGRVVEISSTQIRIYYHTTSVDSEGKEVINSFEGNYFAVTPEIILNNNLDFAISDALAQRIDGGEQIIVAPVGRDVEIQFPINEVISYYQQHSGSLSVVNSLSFKIPVELIKNDYSIAPPANLLLVQSDKKEKFFLDNELVNNETSFYASYNSTDKCYIFSGMRNYLLKMLEKESIEPSDYTFTLTPVTVVTESNTSNSYYGQTTQYVSSIDPYIGAPVMVKLDLDKAEINLTFAKQTID